MYRIHDHTSGAVYSDEAGKRIFFPGSRVAQHGVLINEAQAARIKTIYIFWLGMIVALPLLCLYIIISLRAFGQGSTVLLPIGACAVSYCASRIHIKQVFNRLSVGGTTVPTSEIDIPLSDGLIFLIRNRFILVPLIIFLNAYKYLPDLLHELNKKPFDLSSALIALIFPTFSAVYFLRVLQFSKDPRVN
jgi:hypothetical protein